MSIQTVLSDYIIGLQHVGHVVGDLDTALDTFKRVYGITDASIRRVPEQADDDAQALFAFVTIGDVEFELIQPLSEHFRSLVLGAPSGGAGINHVAWRVTDVDACLETLAEQGIGPGHVTPEGPFSYANMKIVYLDPAACDGMYVELIQIDD